MRIHTVENGENIFSIARKYAIPPTKIIEHNELSEPDRLTRGQRLLILTPTRTHTTRGGDTLDSLAIRYSVSEDALLAANPHLLGERRCYPGKILSVKYDLPRYGVGIGNGFYFEGCSRERLMTMPEVEELYRKMGKHFAHFEPWQIYVITSCETFQKLYGRKADKVRKLYNGMIPCNLYQYFKPQNEKQNLSQVWHTNKKTASKGKI